MPSSFDKLLHRVYLNNYRLAKTSFELESGLYYNVKQNKYSVLITGLARSGTTALLNNFHRTGIFASLSYRDMPFLLAPNLWGKKQFFWSSTRARLHDDNLLISSESPEALDEFFWKVYTDPSYYNSAELPIQELDKCQIDKYKEYINMVCNAYSKEFFVSKNNNSVLRLRSLVEYKVFNKVIVLFRNPLDHASSLLKLHKKFTNDQRNDGFILEYFNFLGHHEFGLNQKPFSLDPIVSDRLRKFDKFELNYWLLSWLNYYKYLSDNFLMELVFIDFTSVCMYPLEVMKQLLGDIPVSLTLEKIESYLPSKYPTLSCDIEILNECLLVYEVLLSRAIKIK